MVPSPFLHGATIYFFGVLHSRVHEFWARAQGTQMRERESGFPLHAIELFRDIPFPQADRKAASFQLLHLQMTGANP